jgi:hypothetical protein
MKSKQKLSSRASAAKKIRDLAYAMTPRRRKMKAENQRKRRAALKSGVDLSDKDYDHTKKKFVSIRANRSGHGKGTKKNNTK